MGSPPGRSRFTVAGRGYAPLRDQVSKWERLEELGQQARRGQGMGMERARGLDRR